MSCEKCEVYKQTIKRLTIENTELKEQARKINIEGWKGKDSLNIKKIGQEWQITEHRKDKATGIVGVITKKIPEQNVISLWEIIKAKTENAQKTKYREVVPSIIMNNNLGLEVEEFNGGKNRKVYFYLYYYPLKILESKGFVRYGGSGSIVRLK